jgi:hypothetical protein
MVVPIMLANRIWRGVLMGMYLTASFPLIVPAGRRNSGLEDFAARIWVDHSIAVERVE